MGIWFVARIVMYVWRPPALFSFAIFVLLSLWLRFSLTDLLWNVQCEREWFHFECVGLSEPPGRTTKWYCPECRKRLGVGEKGQGLGAGGVGGSKGGRKK